MPELPEVESLRRILTRSAVGRTIVGARIGKLPLRRRVVPDFGAMITGRTIERISRRAKYLLFELSGDSIILAHLGMSGSITHRHDGFDAREFDVKHDHLEFALDDASRLVYNDPRRFGMVRLITRGDLGVIAELKGIGPEPLSADFNADYLSEQARGKKVAIKNLIMDQKIVAGVGNIYASEILFHAKVRPTRRAGRVKRAEIDLIVEFTPQGSARGNRQRRHHLSQLSRFARQARRILQAPDGVWARGRASAMCAGRRSATSWSGNARVSIAPSARSETRAIIAQISLAILAAVAVLAFARRAAGGKSIGTSSTPKRSDIFNPTCASTPAIRPTIPPTRSLS